MVRRTDETSARRNAQSIGETTRIITETLQQVLGDKIVAAFLYGSVLADRDRADSDVDVAILEREAAPLLWGAQAEVADLLERACRRPIDLQMLRRGSPSYQVHVFSNGIILYCTDADALERRRCEAQTALDRVHVDQEPAWNRMLRSFADRKVR